MSKALTQKVRALTFTTLPDHWEDILEANVQQGAFRLFAPMNDAVLRWIIRQSSEMISVGMPTYAPAKEAILESTDDLMTCLSTFPSLKLRCVIDASSNPNITLLGAPLAAALALLPDDQIIIPTKLTMTSSVGGEAIIAIEGDGWSLWLIGQRSAIIKQKKDRSLPLPIESIEALRGHWSIPVHRLWRSCLSLGLRALHQGVAHTSPSSHIADSAHLHPSVEISGQVTVGAHTKIWHFSKLLGPLSIGAHCTLGQNVVVERGVRIGNRVKVQNNVSIYSGVVLEDDVFCGPSMVFTNVSTPRSHHPRRGQYETTIVRRGASIGANATIICGLEIGAYALIGAGAVVTRSVPDYALMIGNPARQHAWVCQCGVTLMRSDESAPDHNTYPATDTAIDTTIYINEETVIDTAKTVRCDACGSCYAYHPSGLSPIPST